MILHEFSDKSLASQQRFLCHAPDASHGPVEGYWLSLEKPPGRQDAKGNDAKDRRVVSDFVLPHLGTLASWRYKLSHYRWRACLGWTSADTRGVRLPPLSTFAAILLIALQCSIQADAPVPRSLLEPKNAPEAWNIIRLAAKNVDRLFEEKRLTELPVQLSFFAPALRTLTRSATTP